MTKEVFVQTIDEGLLRILACPRCHNSVALATDGSSLNCKRCGLSFPIHGGIPVMLSPEAAQRIADDRRAAENTQAKRSLARYPALLSIVRWLRPPSPKLDVSGEQCRRRFSESVMELTNGSAPVILDIGSGMSHPDSLAGLTPKVLEGRIPLDVEPFDSVRVVGDGQQLPILSEVVDGVLIQGVLEHVREPANVVAQIFRVIRPGGVVYVEAPFLQHFHYDPIDFYRYTLPGLEYLFRDFQKIDSGVGIGPSSALCDMLTEYSAMISDNPLIYWGIKWIVGWITLPIRYLDLFVAHRKRAYFAALGLYFLGRKV